MGKYWDVKMAGKNVGELLLYGPISDTQLFGDETTPKQIDTDLKALGKLDTLNVRINSGGGNVFAGQAIYTIIQRNQATNKVAYIDGLAASIASVIPLACHRVVMASNALMMIHKPYACAVGTADLMRERANLLDKIEDGIVDIYRDKTGLSSKKIKEMLAAETWLNAEEALKNGFISEIEQGAKIAASIEGDYLVYGGVKVDVSGFKSFDAIKNQIGKKPGNSSKQSGLQEQAREFKRIRSKIHHYAEDPEISKDKQDRELQRIRKKIHHYAED